LSSPSAVTPKEVLIFTATPNEHRSVSESVGRAAFDRLICHVIDCGPGRINASFTVAGILAARLANGAPPAIMAGVGTSGSLSLSLKQGDVIISNSAIISDWRMEDGRQVTVSPYGRFDYRPPDPRQIEAMVIECRDPLIVRLLEGLESQGFRRGRLMTSEAFVTGKEYKLKRGATFGCMACDMESGVYAYIGSGLVKAPWFNVRIVADTLDETLNDYFQKEKKITDILGEKVVEILKFLDTLRS
jgi:nucleoside phosphorylase